MFFRVTLILSWCHFILIDALSFNRPSLIFPQTNVTNSTSHLSLGFSRSCNGVVFGYDLSPESCANALLQIDSADRRLVSYHRWATTPGQANIYLPKRIISGELTSNPQHHEMVDLDPRLTEFSGDGRCVIDIKMHEPYQTGVLSPQRLAFGVLYVIDDCVSGPRAQGGSVMNMGTFNTITLKSFLGIVPYLSAEEIRI